MLDILIFKDLGDRILFRCSPEEISGVLPDLWDAASTHQKWSTMQYRIEDGGFNGSFTDDAMPVEELSFDRRSAPAAALRKQADRPPAAA